MKLATIGLTISLAAAVILVPAAPSHAAGVRMIHPTLCNSVQDASTTTGNPIGNSSPPGAFFVPTVSQFQNGAQTPIIFYCPLISDPTVQIISGSPVTVSLFYNGGTNSNPSVTYAKVCKTFGPPGGGTGTSCNIPRLPTGGAQIYELQPPVNSVNAGDYFYLLVGMGPITSSLLRNQFFGYQIVN